MDIRPSPIAGTWYPGDPTDLTRTIDHFFNEAKVQPNVIEGKIWGIVAPHAGYRYSGPVAAHAFKCLKGLNPDLIVIISPMHHPHHAPLLTTAHHAYRTPLGLVEVDQQAVGKLRETLGKHGLGLTPIKYDQEHSLEIEIPFLQHVFGGFRILPIMIHDQRKKIAEALGSALGTAFKESNVLFVASSDLSHFYPQQMAKQLDLELLRRLEDFLRSWRDCNFVMGNALFRCRQSKGPESCHIW
jgi:AmmeMemoRadiSam system protein B